MSNDMRYSEVQQALARITDRLDCANEFRTLIQRQEPSQYDEVVSEQLDQAAKEVKELGVIFANIHEQRDKELTELQTELAAVKAGLNGAATGVDNVLKRVEDDLSARNRGSDEEMYDATSESNADALEEQRPPTQPGRSSAPTNAVAVKLASSSATIQSVWDKIQFSAVWDEAASLRLLDKFIAVAAKPQDEGFSPEKSLDFGLTRTKFCLCARMVRRAGRWTPDQHGNTDYSKACTLCDKRSGGPCVWVERADEASGKTWKLNKRD